jgi:hypothetical protein
MLAGIARNALFWLDDVSVGLSQQLVATSSITRGGS